MLLTRCSWLSILVIGNAVADIAYRIPHLPRPGETLLASARTVDLDSKGLNQAITARRAGAEARLVAPIGRDAAARRLRDLLVREGLDPALLVADDASTDEAVIRVVQDGENAIVSTADAARRLLPADVAAVVGELGPTDTLLMQGGIPLETTARCPVAALVGQGAGSVVATLGAAGAHLLTGGAHL
jgi:ribokinase